MSSKPTSTIRSSRRIGFSSPTVTGEWLADHLRSVVVADVRWSMNKGTRLDDYLDEHIPGAVLVDLDHDLAGPPTPTGGRHPLPDPGRFAQRLGALGIGDSTPVVAYDDAGGAIAARLWWLLHTLGAPIAVLDGGLGSWPGVLSAAEPDIRPAPRTVRPWPTETLRRCQQGGKIDRRPGARRPLGRPLHPRRPGNRSPPRPYSRCPQRPLDRQP